MKGYDYKDDFINTFYIGDIHLGKRDPSWYDVLKRLEKVEAEREDLQKKLNAIKSQVKKDLRACKKNKAI